jgi:hypothetical protein
MPVHRPVVSGLVLAPTPAVAAGVSLGAIAGLTPTEALASGAALAAPDGLGTIEAPDPPGIGEAPAVEQPATKAAVTMEMATPLSHWICDPPRFIAIVFTGDLPTLPAGALSGVPNRRPVTSEARPS